MSEQNTPSAETIGPYSVFLRRGSGIHSGAENVHATCARAMGILGLMMLVSVGFSGSFLVLAVGMVMSTLALVFGALGMNAAESSGTGRVAAIVGMTTSATAILGSTGLAVFAVWQTP